MIRTDVPTAAACCAVIGSAVIGLALSGCAASTHRDSSANAPGLVAVDVYGGLGGPSQIAHGGPKRVEIVLDVSSSMLERSPEGVAHIDVVRAGVAELVYSLREGTELAVRALGNHQADEFAADRCVVSERIVEPIVPERRDPLVERISDVAAGSESSLANALDHVRRDLILESAAARTRVVVFSDLDSSCGGDLCQAATALVESGAWLEITPIGRANPPKCLAALRPTAASPYIDSRFQVRPPDFRVERARDASTTSPVLAVGQAGVAPVSVPAGLVTVFVGLDPPEEIGPFMVRSGELARIRVLDAFDAALPTRVWRVERGTEPVGRAFPPPPEVGSALTDRAAQ